MTSPSSRFSSSALRAANGYAALTCNVIGKEFTSSRLAKVAIKKCNELLGTSLFYYIFLLKYTMYTNAVTHPNSFHSFLFFIFTEMDENQTNFDIVEGLTTI